MEKFRYNLLDLVLIPISFHLSVRWWKRLCLKKHALAHQLNIY